MMTSSNGNIFHVTGPLCGEFTGPGEFPTQRPVRRSFDVFFDLHLNKRLNKQSRGWWFETLSRPFWRHRNVPFAQWASSMGLWWFLCCQHGHVFEQTVKWLVIWNTMVPMWRRCNVCSHVASLRYFASMNFRIIISRNDTGQVTTQIIVDLLGKIRFS